MSDARYVLGVDLGGTKILSLCLDGALRIVGRDLRPTDAEAGLAAVLDRLLPSARPRPPRPAAAAGAAPGPASSASGSACRPGSRTTPTPRRWRSSASAPE